MPFHFTCLHCTKPFTAKQRRHRDFCSKPCSTTYMNLHRSPEQNAKISVSVKLLWEGDRVSMLAGLAKRDTSRSSIAAKERWKDPDFRGRIVAARQAVGYRRKPDAPARAKLRTFCKNALRRCLNGKTKEGRTRDLLGYSTEDLRKHIEALFLPGMTWENYGTWEIDHDKPIASFGLDAPLGVINALSNLKPLWKLDNRKKGYRCE